MPSKNQENEQQRQFYFGDNMQEKNQPFKFCSNFIKTTKYNIATFIPYSFILQFKVYANIYFLVAAILQAIPTLSTLSPASAIFPLIFVLSLSMLREGIEDYRKYKSDKENNASTCYKLIEGHIEKSQWSQIQIGDILKIQSEELIPADCIVIKSALDSGQCFIETSSLDGEKTLKPKQVLPQTQNYSDKDYEIFNGTVVCNQPNPLLFSYEGYMQEDGKQKVALGAKNLILRGARLKNVDYVYGMVTYTGKDTKVMKNSDKSKTKQTTIQKRLNKYIWCLLILQLICCITVAFGNVFVCKSETNITYELDLHEDCWQQFFYVIARYFLLLNTMLPISLVVSLEFIKVGQAFFMERDQEMVCEENDKSLKVNTCTINEELGQIQYIFTDKTGTLTCNQMEFKMLVCGTEVYGDGNEIQNKNNLLSVNPLGQDKRKRGPSHYDEKSGASFCFKDDYMAQVLKEEFAAQIKSCIDMVDDNGKVLYEIHNQKQLIQENLFILSLCHECVLNRNEETGKVEYQGPSPDEITLVDAARHLGYKFNGVNKNKLLLNYNGKNTDVELLHLFEFDSDRKRMSVIIRDNGVIKMLIKGADSIIINRLKQDIKQPYLEHIQKKLGQFSCKGLRTLCLAMKVITEQELEEINLRIKATYGQQNQEKLIKEVAESIEKDLYLIGATAVEDRLQDQVPETLRDLLKANIKVWMLTGDKLETAENIGKSCNMIEEGMNITTMPGSLSHKQMHKRLQSFKEDVEKAVAESYGFIVEGEALAQILEQQKLTLLFLQVVLHCKSVICCRVTPKQKAEVVKLVKERLNKITLSIGDGANDVNMIQEAHIGVGIYGNEGMRAVQASDYAIGQFRCLWKLVLFHGRMSYIRISDCILYFFYKNIIFTIQQFYFAFFCSFSAQSLFDDWYITFYNVLFTFCPCVLRAIMEEDVYYKKPANNEDKGVKMRISKFASDKQVSEEEDEIRSLYPSLYYIGQKNQIFHVVRFMQYILQGLGYGGLLFVINFYTFGHEVVIAEEGYSSDIWSMSISLFTSIVVLVNLKLALNTQYWTIITWTSLLITSVGAYFVYVLVANEMKMFVIYQTASTLLASPIYYVSVCFSVLSAFTVDLLIFSIKTSEENLLNYVKKVQRLNQDLNVDKAMELHKQQQMAYRNSNNVIEMQLLKDINEYKMTGDNSLYDSLIVKTPGQDPNDVFVIRDNTTTQSTDATFVIENNETQQQEKWEIKINNPDQQQKQQQYQNPNLLEQNLQNIPNSETQQQKQEEPNNVVQLSTIQESLSEYFQQSRVKGDSNASDSQGSSNNIGSSNEASKVD